MCLYVHGKVLYDRLATHLTVRVIYIYIYISVTHSLCPGTSTSLCPGTSTLLCPGTSTLLCLGTSTLLCPGTSTLLCPGTSTLLCFVVACAVVLSRNQLEAVPRLPASLTKLSASSNRLTSIPDLRVCNGFATHVVASPFGGCLVLNQSTQK